MDSAAEDSRNADGAGDVDDLISGLHDDVLLHILEAVARALGARSRAPLRLSPAGGVVHHSDLAVRSLGAVRLLRQRRPFPAW